MSKIEEIEQAVEQLPLKTIVALHQDRTSAKLAP